jgi:hypothetical protein
VTDAATPLPDTPFTRAWTAAGKMFTDEAKRISFFTRVGTVMPFITDKKYAKYVHANSMHVALTTAIATVPFGARTTPKALRAAFDGEFRRALASTIQMSQRVSEPCSCPTN